MNPLKPICVPRTDNLTTLLFPHQTTHGQCLENPSKPSILVLNFAGFQSRIVANDQTFCIICSASFAASCQQCTLFWLPSEAAMTRPLSATLTRSRVRSNATRDHGWTTTCKKIRANYLIDANNSMCIYIHGKWWSNIIYYLDICSAQFKSKLGYTNPSAKLKS